MNPMGFDATYDYVRVIVDPTRTSLTTVDLEAIH